MFKNEEKEQTRAGGAFFKYLNLTNFDLPKYGLFKNIDRNNYKHNFLFSALEARCWITAIDINIKESNDS